MFTVNLKLISQIKPFFSHRTISKAEKTAQILSELTGLTHPEAVGFIAKHGIHQKDPEDVKEAVKYCRNLGYTTEDLLRHPNLLKRPRVWLEQHHWSLEEGGFKIIGPDILARTIYYMRRSVHYLKSNGFIEENCDVTRCFLSYIRHQKVFVEELSKPRPNDSIAWCDVRFNILCALLRRRLGATKDDLVRLFRIHKMIRYKSFRVIQDNIEIAENLGFSPQKILKCGYLLNNYPDYPRTLLRDYGNLAGVDMKRAMRFYPKLTMTSPKNALKVYEILKKFKISNEAIQKCPNVLNMSPDTVHQRLQIIKETPDLEVLLKHPRVVKLIVHHTRAKSRLEFLQLLKLRCTSFAMLETGNASKFQEYVQEGKDVNKEQDTYHFLSCSFPNCNKKTLRNQIKLHPFYLHVPLKDMSDTYNYLLRCNFKPDSISKCVWILLYPVKKLNDLMDKLRNEEGDKFEALSDVQKLNLILYTIERDHHFTGNGIWQDDGTEALYEKSLE